MHIRDMIARGRLARRGETLLYLGKGCARGCALDIPA